MTPRAKLAAAVRPFGPNGKLLAEHVAPLDALADALGLPRDDALDAPAPAIGHNGGPKIGLADQDFADVAAALGCEPAQIRAVWEVESGGGWFTDVRADILDLDGPGNLMTLSEAIREVEQGRCQRIASPGKWKVWREGDKVKHERTGQ